jgi:hypothetical protein
MALHKGGVRHRDIKPQNVIVDVDGSAMLMDTGVIEVATDDDATMHTSVKDFVGSVRYAAPQFILGDPYDYADDVYSLAATLYLPVTGVEIFGTQERKPLLPHRILTEHAKVSSLRPGVPDGIAVVLEGALNRDRKRRPSLEEFRAFIDTPDKAPYLQRELDARNKEERGFVVLQVLDKGATIFADVRHGDVEGVRYAVIRECEPIPVPSMGGKVKPERWVADVELRHVHDGVGHFAVQTDKWHPGSPPSRNRFVYEITGTPGEWIQQDKHVESVRPGDLVVRRG